MPRWRFDMRKPKCQSLQSFMPLPESKAIPPKPRLPEPLFVRVKGCINCHVHDMHKEKYGSDYGCFDHELMAGCLLNGCDAYHHSICNPFIHPDEIRRLALKDGRKEIIDKAENVAIQIEKAFKINRWTL